MNNLGFSGHSQSGEKASAMAGVTHKDFSHVMLYDAFTSGQPIMLESLGFCKPGKGRISSRRVSRRPLERCRLTPMAAASPTRTPGCTDFPIIESTRQLRGECGPRQVPNVKISLVNGMGGMLSAAGTLGLVE